MKQCRVGHFQCRVSDGHSDGFEPKSGCFFKDLTKAVTGSDGLLAYWLHGARDKVISKVTALPGTRHWMVAGIPRMTHRILSGEWGETDGE